VARIMPTMPMTLRTPAHVRSTAYLVTAASYR
jgi:hypothetical protein